MKKPLAIGVEDYKKIIEKPYYYKEACLDGRTESVFDGRTAW